ncbi:adenylate/guanylate cyclase domain-containing protein [Paraglaciecola chathamensis]|jgi:adenylate cyclase|uniref:Adenylate/guanylate cyclase domain-containing protein n=1 Tax=Paraglaciecola chathamensis TaxID=368405 RepID=A0ABS0WB17_9ALTE|nr:adenylate/guanylate cyclase domain-containing protein [Paraglaciecola chathamensis]MBJ2135633.1 adenylate/guanylate cyclase domain-containing protein [Paraglaciecola chathamensis]
MLETVSQPLPLALLALCIICFIIIAFLLYKLSKLSTSKSHKTSVKLRSVNQIKQTDVPSDRFEQKADEALRLRHTFQKFVPKQFVDHFAKHGATVLELGHAVEDDVAILFCDIRGFTGLSEKMSPQELMRFLNSYFLRMNDPIHLNSGFIDKFIGDAIMALFDHPDGGDEDKAQDALCAALDLRRALTIYNQHRQNSGYASIDMGIGIHFGPVVLGTVGSDDRMDTTVIGDSVNIAYRLEALAPIYQCDIVVSAQALQQAAQPERFTSRLLDWVKVKGRSNAIEIHEVIAHLPQEQQQLKQSNSALIKQGLGYRFKQNWVQAINCFEQAAKLSPEDHLPRLHILQCQQLAESALPENWDGTVQL